MHRTSPNPQRTSPKLSGFTASRWPFLPECAPVLCPPVCTGPCVTERRLQTRPRATSEEAVQGYSTGPALVSHREDTAAMLGGHSRHAVEGPCDSELRPPTSALLDLSLVTVRMGHPESSLTAPSGPRRGRPGCTAPFQSGGGLPRLTSTPGTERVGVFCFYGLFFRRFKPLSFEVIRLTTIDE